jgi:hypothetical protein
MRELVREEEIEQVRQCLEVTPLLKNELGIDWIKSNLLTIEKRATKHYLFWLFVENWKVLKIERWLTDLRIYLPQPKFRKIINYLKAKNNKTDFNSLISELEVLAYYSNKGLKVEYEPNIPEKRKIGDIKLTFGSIEVFIEVTRLFESQDEKNRDLLVNSIVDAIDALPYNPFIITVDIADDFSSLDVQPCIKFVSDEILRLKDILEPVETKPFELNYGSKVIFRFFKRITHKTGYVGGSLIPSLDINDSSRVKNKILGELNQLPYNRLNIIAIDISHYFLDFDDVEDALKGQLGYQINLQTGEGRTVRNLNGIIHMKTGQQVGLVIAFKSFDFENRKKLVNLSAKILFPEEILAVL